LATSQPSFSIDRVTKPPPGATITAAPVALAGSGRNGVSVASVTLRTNELPYCLCQLSVSFAPGSGPVSSLIAFGWAGVAIGVMASFCADAGSASTASASGATTISARTANPLATIRPPTL